MFQSQNELHCSQCGRVIDIGDSFLTSATFPARSFSQDDVISIQFFENQAEVLCQACAIDRLGIESLAKLSGTVFSTTASKSKKASAR